jgi:hypothetical protein
MEKLHKIKYVKKRRYLKKRRDRMLREEEVPHERRKDFLSLWFFGRMGCGKRRGDRIGLDFLFEGVLLPQADGWMGLFLCCCF